MLLKKIKLKNIRSYKEAEIDFPLGSTVLAGDIGSGKTTILLAIEFAFFGLQPGQKGNALLRNGESISPLTGTPKDNSFTSSVVTLLRIFSGYTKAMIPPAPNLSL